MNNSVALTPKACVSFQTIIWSYYHEHGRAFAWRETNDPYHIVVSEIMLQQTQTHRVAKKYFEFISKFPDFKTLAHASLRDLLLAWQGLGYNRRALALQKTAQKVMEEYEGILPANPELLVEFPGIGKATASSICAFAFNMPTIFVETNIRSVYIHFFFQEHSTVNDKTIIPLVEQTVDQKNPREWYYALMDYGVMLKKKFPNPSRKSAHHATQSTFEGSDRQVRGLILKTLALSQPLSSTLLAQLINRDLDRVERIVEDLCNEGFIKKNNTLVSIA